MEHMIYSYAITDTSAEYPSKEVLYDNKGIFDNSYTTLLNNQLSQDQAFFFNMLVFCW